MYCRNRPNVISNDLKCAGGWGSDLAGGAYDAPPDPLIVSGFAPKALAPRPLRRLQADPPSFFGTNLTLVFCTRPTKNRGGPRCVTYFWGVPGCVPKCDRRRGVKIGQK